MLLFIKRTTVLNALLCTLCILLGCEAPVDPVLDTASPFTVYGYFTTGADTQSAVIIPIRGKLEPGDPTEIDARVRSEDLKTGETVMWRDSVVFYESGRFAHVFWAPFRAEADHSYRLTVSRSDGRSVQAVVRVPEEPVATFKEPTIFGVSVVTQKVAWKPVTRLLETEVAYFVNAALKSRTIVINYEGERADDGWIIDVQLTEDKEVIDDIIGKQAGAITLSAIEMRIVSVNDAWNPPGGTFDYTLLAQPGTMSNVENGFGFVGAGVADTLRWRPEKEILKLLGYRVFD